MEHSVRPKWSAGYELKDCVGEHKNQDNMYDENVRKLKFKFDVEELKGALEEVLEHSDINKVDQLCMTYSSQYPQHPDGDEYQGSGSLFYEYYATTEGVKNRRKNYQPERTFTEFVPAYKHTYFYHVWKELSKEYKLGRMRLMCLRPSECYNWHMDPTEHIHVPILSNPGNKLVIGNNTYYLPADGSTYITDTTKFHTAFNGGKEHRYNILINLLDDMQSLEVEKERIEWCHSVDVIRYRFRE